MPYRDGACHGTSTAVVAELIRKHMGGGEGGAAPSDQEILETSLFPLVNEGAKILDEGIAQRPSEIDVVWLFGYGWTQHTGGPMRWADNVGLKRIRAKAEELGRDDPNYAPSPLLTRLASGGKGFADFQSG